MSKIANAFDHGKALIPFITCGDPCLERTKEYVCAMAEAGADLIELGIPFSDPMAEGSVIMEASARALEAGATTEKIFDLVRELRKETALPMVFMTYANVLFSYGLDKFMSISREIGIDGFILPDVPFEEKEEFDCVAKRYELDLISLIAPTSRERIAMIAREAEGFLYCVSSLGVTGMRSKLTGNVGEMVRAAREVTNLPCAIGFGISGPAQAAEMAKAADGVIVGSAYMKLIAEHGNGAAPHVERFTRELKEAICE